MVEYNKKNMSMLDKIIRYFRGSHDVEVKPEPVEKDNKPEKYTMTYGEIYNEAKNYVEHIDTANNGGYLSTRVFTLHYEAVARLLLIYRDSIDKLEKMVEEKTDENDRLKDRLDEMTKELASYHL